MSRFRYPLAQPDLDAGDKAYAQKVLDSALLSRGPMVRRFEQAFAEALGCRHAVALSSGSAALHLALLALGVQAGDEVITTPFTVPATANMIVAAGATVRFCDIDPHNLGLDPQAAAAAINANTRAILPVHAFGIPADLDALLAVARDHRLALVEDACEALGGTHTGRALGTLGDCGCFGFYPNKQITTGEGGMLVTDRAELAQQARLLRNHGRSMDGRWLDQLHCGLNYRMPELAAALGLGQIQRLPRIVAVRQRIAQWYRLRLAAMDGVQLPDALVDSAVSPFALVVLLDQPGLRDPLIQWLDRQGIQAARYFALLHRQPAWRKHADLGPMPVTEAVAARILALPFYHQLEESDVDQICQALGEGLQECQPLPAGAAS